MPTTTTAKPKKKSALASVREQATKNLWTKRATPLQYGREEFRFRVNRDKRRLATIDIDPWVETCDWERSGGHRTGELNFYKPLGAHTASMIARGDEVLCEWAQFGGRGPWSRLWRMKIETPSLQIQQGIISLALTSVLGDLRKSKVAWKFRTDKQHPHGWTADQITLAVCRRFHIPIGDIPKATYRIHKYVQKSKSPDDVITWAWTQERRHTNRRFDIDESTGLLTVKEIAEPQFLLILGADMLDATVTQSMNRVASTIIATAAHKGSGKKAKKLRVRIVNQGRLDRYGYIAKTLHAPSGINSTAELRKWAKDELASVFNGRQKVSFTHPGIPLMDRGTAMRVYLPEADLDEIAFATDVRHDISAGDYEMEVSVGFNDPWSVDQRKKRVAAKKAAAAARRGRAGGSQKSTPTAKKATVRSNA